MGFFDWFNPDMIHMEEHRDSLEEVMGQKLKLETKIVELEKELSLHNVPKEIRYTRVKVFDTRDPGFIEYIAGLMDDERFRFFLEDTMNDFVVILRKINPGDPESADKRLKAAYRMDGVQFLVNKLAEIRSAHLQLQAIARAEKEGEDDA